MQKNSMREAAGYLERARRRRLWLKVVGILGCIVVFCTTYALILPAVTMENSACGLEEHIHTEECYTQVTAVIRKEPVCSAESLDIHEHTGDCLDENGEPDCGYADFVIHGHDASCYDGDGTLWCPLPEITPHTHSGDCFSAPDSETVHTHTDECYTTKQGDLICTESTEAPHIHDADCYEEKETLICDMPENDGHQHGEDCYDEDGQLICTSEESDGHQHGSECYETTSELVCTLSEEAHQHTDECYEQDKVLTCELSDEPSVETEPELVCDKEEIIPHEHVSSCFDENGSLICGRRQVLEHVHSDACFETVEEAVDTETLTCGLAEGEGAHAHGESCYDENGELVCGLEENDGHQHGLLCYGTWELTCGMEEHQHDESCQIVPELTEEEQAQVDEVIALIDALPTQEEIEETMAAFEEAGDEDGYDAYLTELVARVKAAYKAYSALTEVQQAKVINAAKLMALEPLWSAQTLEDAPTLKDDSARVTAMTVTGITDGTGPFDENDDAGNDSNAQNRIVRTFDTVTYNFEVQMASYDNDESFGEARVKLEFVLPLTSDQAVFDQSAMAWMDQTGGYAPVLTEETRSIDGTETQCQVLTCYKHLLPAENHPSVVPGTFGENVTVNVKSMKHKETFAPIFSAAMEYGTWEGECSKHTETEKATVTADKITVSAAPKYNIRIGGSSTYKSTFDFNSGNAIAQAYGDGYEKGQVTGRVVKYGVVIQLYNDNASKKLKGIELPNGDPITFDLKVSSEFTINMPNSGSGYTQGQKVNTTEEYTPLLWSCDENMWTSSGQANSDGRVLYDTHGCAQGWAPYARGGGANACLNSGQWRATQTGDTIHVTVSGYQIDVDNMPATNGDTTTGNTGAYGVDLGIGCFSAGEIWLVQPYNKIGDTSADQGPEFDVVKKYGQGKFDTSAHAVNMTATTVSGAEFKDPDETSNAQMKNDDDWAGAGVELTLPGGLQNRVAYANPQNYNWGVGVTSYRDGLDFATVGTEIRLLGGFSYNHRNESDNLLYWGTNLTKFYGSAIEIINSPAPNPIYTGGAQAKEFTVLYATKKDGTDWRDDQELLTTYEDAMIFYKNLSEIPEGHLCVGLLFCFREDTFGTIGEPYFFGQQPAKVRDNMDLTGKTYMLASTSRVWTRSMFEQSSMLGNIPDWTNPQTKLNSFPSGYYKSANIAGSTWYTKTDYSQANSGIVKDHNSDWRHWGDTLLAIGYKTEITKTMPQRGSNSSTEKDTYNLDAEQRVVDFKLQPYTKYDQGSGIHALTTTVTIVDTLPKYLTYVSGSSYFGGEYNQTSPNGGTQGTITGGVLREPTVEDNADGTQTLTWVIPDVTVGETMPAIYYSANIGNRNNQAEDVPNGTTNLVNRVRISATHDIRQPNFDNRNYAEAGLAVTRGSAASYGKYSVQDVVDADGEIDYVIYYDNNGSTAEAAPVLVDAMPINGVGGSKFSGTWKITDFKISLTGTNVTLKDLDAHLSWTFDEYYAGKTLKDLQTEQDNPQGKWEGPEPVVDGNAMPELGGKMPVMWVMNCISLPAGSELRVEYTIKLTPEPGSTIDNIQYANTFSTSKTTTTTETPAVNRTLEGLTWLDDSADGIQNEDTGHRISGVRVTLLKLKENGDPLKEGDYAPYCYPGTSTPVEVVTGQKISVRATENSAATDYEPGRYKFTDLPAGTFAVRFTDGTDESAKISSWIASPSNRGNDDTQDSDGIATYSADRSRLEQTMILGIEMPRAENMSVVLYESRYHDSGFYEKSHELPHTGGSGTIPYTMGGLLAIGAGLILLYKEKNRRKEDSASS